MTLQALENLREQQSLALAYFDTFLVFAAVGVALSSGLCNAGRAARRVRVLSGLSQRRQSQSEMKLPNCPPNGLNP